MNCKQESSFVSQWCPGCGNFVTLECLKTALCNLQLKARDYVIAAGIGQSAKLGFSLQCNLLAGLHGRALPLAMGLKMANHQLKVLAVSGDGCFYAEGGNHLLHTARRNLDVTMLASDNRVFGLTKGQASPTAAADFTTKIHPEGVGAQPLEPTLVALSAGATFVAKAFTGNPDELTTLIEKAIQHQGFALIDILSPCVSFNKVNTFAWFKKRIQPIQDDHDRNNLAAALQLAQFNPEEEIPTGIYYQTDKPVYGLNKKAMRGAPIAVRTESYKPERVKPLFARYR